jgi:hypothetical protein
MEEHYLTPSSWLQSIRDDYLRTYLSQGGASVKVVVANVDERASVRAALQAIASANGFQYAHVDAASRRIHLVHNLFTAIAQQLDWGALSRAFMRRALEEKTYRIPSSGDLAVEALAEANDEAKDLLIKDLRKIVTNRVFRDYALSREFRLASTALCRAAYDHSTDVQQEAADARAWLSGTLDRMSALRRLGIFRKVNRNNARQLLFSTTAWIRSADAGGLVATVDMSRYAQAKGANADGESYTKMASLDMHEVLREFVDGTDELHASLIVFLTGEEFLTSEDRGLRNYDALRLRLTDDVRDRRRPNPFAPMVRLRGAA